MKIAFIYPIPVSYRIPLFEILSKKYNLNLLFTKGDKYTMGENVYKSRTLKNIRIPFMNRYVKGAYGSPEIPYTLFYHLVHDEYDLIITKNLNSISTYIAFLASHIKRKPFIIWEETWNLNPILLRRILRPFSSFLIKASDAIVVSGTNAKKYILSYGADKEKIFIAPNASQSYSRINKKKLQVILYQLGLEKQIIILFLGRLIKLKGVDYLINAFKLVQENIKNCALLIAGAGDQQIELQEICKKLGLKNVLFLGYASENKKHILYSIAHVLVLPSIRIDGFAEVWGLTVNEAMSSGIPVICTDAVGAAHDLIVDGFNGFIVKERDPQALAHAILKTIRDKRIAIAMGLRSKKIITSHFTYNHMAEGFFKAINFVCKNDKHRI